MAEDLKREIEDFFVDAKDQIFDAAKDAARDAVLGGGCKIQLIDLSRFVAIQIARLEALFISKVYEFIQLLLDKLQVEVCPPWNEIEKLLRIRDNVIKLIINIQKRLTLIISFASKLKAPIKVAQVLIKILKLLPVPNATTTMGVTNTSSDALQTACRFLEQLKNEITTIEKLVASIVGSLARLQAILESVDIQIGTCLAEENKRRLATGDDSPIEGLILNSDGTLRLADIPFNYKSAIGGLGGSQFYIAANGQRYSLEVINDPNSPAIAQRRQAIARDTAGVIILRGPKSFSSSEEVLIQEIKFRLDNQLS